MDGDFKISKEMDQDNNKNSDERLKNSDNVPKDDDEKKKLKQHLKNCGLNVDVWTKVLREKFKVEGLSQLQGFSGKEITQLQSFATQDHEKKNIKNLLKPTCSPEQLLALKETITDLKNEMRHSDAKQSDEFKRQLQKLQAKFSVDDHEFVLPTKKDELNAFIDSVSNHFEKLQANTIYCQNLLDHDVIENASGGLALSGIYPDDLEQTCQRASSVLELKHKDTVRLKQSNMTQLDKVETFNDCKKYSKSHHDVETLGVKMSGEVKAMYFPVSVDTGGSRNKHKEKEERTKHNSQTIFYCREKSCTVPVKSFEMKQSSVCLTPEAVSRLRKIEDLMLRDMYKKEIIQAECIAFFKEFGSFVNLGILEFGGTYRWKATYESEFKSDEKKTKEELTTALNGYVAAGISFGPKSLGGCISKGDTTETGKSDLKHTMHDRQKTSLEINKTGGPIDVDNFHMWRCGLVSFNSTWSLIDRGVPVGIWKLVDNHETDFSESKQLSRVLQDAWEKRKINSNEDLSQWEIFDRKMTLILQKMKKWSEVSEPNINEVVNILQDLISRKMEMSKFLELEWDGFVATNNTVQMLFLKIFDQKERFDYFTTQLVKTHLKEILMSINAYKVPAYMLILSWIREDENQNSCSHCNFFCNENVEDLNKFLKITKQHFISDLELENGPHEDCITREFQRICSSCLHNMQQRKLFFNVILLTSVLVPYDFDVIYWIFRRHLTVSRLKKIKEEVYNMLPLQETASLQNEISIANHFIESIRNKAYLYDDDNLIFKRYFSPIAADECTKEFNALLRGQETSYQFELKALQLKLVGLQSNDNKHFSLGYNTGIQTLENNQRVIKTNKPESNNASHSFNEFIAHFDLFDYYPDKIKLNDVLGREIISKSVLKDIPWIFLKGILSCDRRWRGDFLSKLMTEVNVPDSGGYIDEWSMKTNEDGREQSNRVSINPLDLTVAVYQCCSPSLKQLFAEKMWLCKLAFPLMIYHSDKLVANLWSIRQCIIEDTIDMNEFEEKSAADTNSLIVSVIRFGKICVSKSNIINNLISTNGNNVFHHTETSLGDTVRTISNGTIESAWCISSDITTTYLNLRGDALSYAIQVQVLLTLSSVLVVMFPIDKLEDECIQNIINKSKSNCGIILAFDGKETKKNDALKKMTSFFDAHSLDENKIKISGLAQSGKQTSLNAICYDLNYKISSLVKNKKNDISFSERLKSCDQPELCVDEKLEMYQRFMHLADDVMNLLPRDSSNLKKIVVPLQGRVLESLTYSLKTAKKSSDKLEKGKLDALLNTVEEKRKEQAQMQMKPTNSFVKETLALLKNIVPKEENYIIFVKYLKLFLDRESRKVIPKERKKYQQTLLKIQQAIESNEVIDASLKKEVEAREKGLADAAFGLEHVYREFGQIYEAMSSQKAYLNEEDSILLEQIPKIAANLLLHGESFELMNGDVGNVPLIWIESVFGHIKSIISNKKVLILSVLGLQSSGKSTLLNTMFGLQFAVSAGRCTRGLYMQLLPVNNKKGFDYLLVVDTEGIRAPELKDQNYHHDNELATFVIGLGDVILININGENTAELTDILGIVVQALLRLKIVTKNSPVRKRCVFVHQNVPAFDARDKMLQQRKILVDKLNKRTKSAAAEESVPNINCFSDILNFDFNNDVIYFPGLLDGNAPMASVNYGYSERAQQVKDSIMSKPIPDRNTYYTFSETFTHMSDLWNGLLADDFVFSFRNNLEINTYMRIQSKFQEIAFGLETYMNDYVCKECKTELQGKLEETSDRNPMLFLKDIEDGMDSKFSSKLQEQHEKLVTIFEKDEKKDIVIQWKESKKNQLDELYKSLVFVARKRLQLLVGETRFRMIQESQIADFETKAYNMADKLACRYKGKYPEADIVMQEFELAWSGIADVLVDDTSDPVNIRKVLHDMFQDRLTSIKHFQIRFNEKWQAYDKTQKLSGSIASQDIDTASQIVPTDSKIRKVLDVLFKKPTTARDPLLKPALTFSNIIFRSIDNEIETFSSTTNRKFDSTFVKKLFTIIVTNIKNHNDEGKCPYKFTKEYETSVLVYTSLYLQKKLTDLNDDYNKKFSLKSKQKQHKSKAWTIFRMIVDSESQDGIAAFYFEEILFNAVSEKFLTLIPTRVVDEMINTFYTSKWELIKQILIHLASQGSFHDFLHYIKSPQMFVQIYLRKRTNERFFKNINGSTEYFNFAVNQATTDLNCVSQVLYDLKTQNTADCTNDQIVDLLHMYLQSNLEVIITKSAFDQVKLRLKNKERFLEKVVSKLDGLKKSVPKQFEDTSEKNVQWTENPVDKMMKILWGCDAKCPFCYEPCMNAQKGHTHEDPHRCSSHRVDGIAGWYFKETKTLSTHFCNRIISSSSTSFKHKGKYIVYKDYKTIYPEWDIRPNPEVSVYWKWFCSKYKKCLEEEYGKKIEILDQWKKLSMSEAINSITHMSS